MVVGNGYARAREITTAAGRIAVQAPRIDDRRDGERYIPALLPPYMRRSPKVTELLPLLYLRGLSTGDFLPALSAFFGSEAGLSASTVSRLSEAWQAEHERWRRRRLAAVDYVYLWADGVHFTVRLEEDRLCCLVLAGVWPYVVVPYRLTETPLRVTAPAPCLGEHSAQVLARLAGVDGAGYEELVRRGISGEDPPQ